MYPHRIRLRGPWEIDVVSLAGGLSTARVSMPARWEEIGLDGHAGVVRIRRRFGLPRHLDDWERVWLIGQGLTGRASWSLNGKQVRSGVGGQNLLEAEITSLLRERNELGVELQPGGADEFVWEELALEIRCRAFLRNIGAVVRRTQAGWVIQVHGELVKGQPGDALELYALVDGRNQDYQQVQTDEPVSPVKFILPLATTEVGKEEAGKEVTVRVDLVNVSTVWHTAECVVKLGD
jgi:hypothetical protein